MGDIINNTFSMTYYRNLFLNDAEDPSRRAKALLRVALIPGGEFYLDHIALATWEKLVSLDTDNDSMIDLLSAVRVIRTPESLVPRLISAAQNSRYSAARAQAINVLQDWSEREDVRQLALFAESDPSVSVRKRAEELLDRYNRK